MRNEISRTEERKKERKKDGRFRDETKEENYRQTKISNTKTNSLFKWIIYSYAFIVFVCLLISTIKSYENNDAERALTYLLLSFAVVIVFAIEYLFRMFPKARVLHGFLPMQLSMVINVFYFEFIILGEEKATGDLGIFMVQLLIGLDMCYNWIITSISTFLSYAIYILLYSAKVSSLTGIYFCENP